ncbi:taste receptor type 2 member 40-like [Paroedura picta]|uniref:taste receptor type 2 member 40-like n=1 Tax=Paroedura picta TaxID=143630 RepID=UPI0040565A74
MATDACSVPVDELTAFKLTMLVIFGMESIVGAWVNAFIVTICCISRLKNKSLSAGDQILMVLAANRFCFLITGMLRILCKTLSPTIYYKDFVYQGLKATLWFFISSNFWLAGCLCLFYCLKIANFSHRLFISLKLKISQAVPALLLSSELLSFVNIIPFYNPIYTSECNMQNATTSGNATANQISMKTDSDQLLYVCGLSFSVGLVIFVTSAVLLLVSLWRHTQRLRDVLSSGGSASMAAHVRAVKVIMHFVITYLVNFVALMILLTNAFPGNNNLISMITVVVNACPSVHSIVLILNNPKFKKAFLQHAGCKR